jgi:hypothetical protein
VLSTPPLMPAMQSKGLPLPSRLMRSMPASSSRCRCTVSTGAVPSTESYVLQW